jgi:hypothetical protein
VIKSKTTFILGAGASKPYGFDSGGEMLTKAKVSTANDIYSDLGGRMEADVVENFSQSVRDSQNESLDGFLEHRKDTDPILLVGKRWIAHRLLSQEVQSLEKFEVNGDWIQYLYSRMVADINSVDEFRKQNAVTFITYNYDRLLEHRLAHALQVQFEEPLEKCAAVFDDIKVIHLHGSLGKLYPTGSDSTGVVPFGPGAAIHRKFTLPVLEFLEDAGKTIQIVHQATPDTPEFKAAQAALSADQIFFMGFGFGQTNMQRLNCQKYMRKPTRMYMTRYHMTDREFDIYAVRSLQEIGQHYFRNVSKEWDCLDLLRENVQNLLA